jgi:hypothetical protein
MQQGLVFQVFLVQELAQENSDLVMEVVQSGTHKSSSSPLLLEVII